MEDPLLDARAAAPVWTHGGVDLVHLTPDQAAPRFDLWRFAGPKSFFAEDETMVGVIDAADASGVRFRLVPTALEHGFAFSIPSGPGLADRLRAAHRFHLRANGATPKPAQPKKSAFDHMHRLMALDGQSLGLGRREVAGLIFGQKAVRDWADDPRHRSNMRYLLQRAEALRDGGYRLLAGLPPRDESARPIRMQKIAHRDFRPDRPSPNR